MEIKERRTVTVARVLLEIRMADLAAEETLRPGGVLSREFFCN